MKKERSNRRDDRSQRSSDSSGRRSRGNSSKPGFPSAGSERREKKAGESDYVRKSPDRERSYKRTESDRPVSRDRDRPAGSSEGNNDRPVRYRSSDNQDNRRGRSGESGGRSRYGTDDKYKGTSDRPFSGGDRERSRSNDNDKPPFSREGRREDSSRERPAGRRDGDGSRPFSGSGRGSERRISGSGESRGYNRDTERKGTEDRPFRDSSKSFSRGGETGRSNSYRGSSERPPARRSDRERGEDAAGNNREDRPFRSRSDESGNTGRNFSRSEERPAPRRRNNSEEGAGGPRNFRESSDRPFRRRSEAGESRDTKDFNNDRERPPFERRERDSRKTGGEGDFKRRPTSDRPGEERRQPSAGGFGRESGSRPVSRLRSNPERDQERPFRPRRDEDSQEERREPRRRSETPYSARANESGRDYAKAGKRAETAKDDSLIRLNRYISNSGICSRREADVIIESGVITVNGQVVTELGTKVSDSDIVKYNGQLLRREKPVYLLLNKPKDFITTTDDPQERKTVMQLVESATEDRIYPVGRLDRNTTGLLLFTNDGEMATRLMHPKYDIKKIYLAQLDKKLTKAHFAQILEGLELEDGLIKIDELSYVDDDHSQVGIEIHSGRNRIIHRIFEHLGYVVEKLDRVLYGDLSKKDLPRGKWRFLTDLEIRGLKKITRIK